jgi:RNA polymerase sigma factor (TIGR02999 family)
VRTALSADDPGAVTRLLAAWSDGDRTALDELMPLVHAQLHALARRLLRREGGGGTQLQPTELIHEAFLKLVDQSRVRWRERQQFYAVSARLMRRVLVDHARSRGARKRGGEAVRITISGTTPAAPSIDLDVLALDMALERLSELDARQARLVELRFFGGLGFEEAAALLEISTATAKRDWVHARAWLFRELSGGSSDPPPEVS